MFNPFRLFGKVFTWFNEGISTKAKVILAVFGLLFFAGMGVAGYKINDYFEHDPNACMMCHVHDEANKAWAHSEHKTVNCHECHRATKKDQVEQMYRFAVLGQKTVSPRHGKIIVPSKLCMECHWDRNPGYPDAPAVNRSGYHAKHVFVEQIECTKCHGYITHKFLPEQRFCLKCHTDREVRGKGMEQLPCLNCHTDRTADLRPGRTKCLFCHGDEKARKELADNSTMDVKYFRPSKDTIGRATKVSVSANAPMQFNCSACHKPHTSKVKPDSGDCLKCHRIAAVGRHELHVKTMKMKCVDCHKPHSWKVTEAQARTDCMKCHGYRDLKKFVGA